MPDLLDHATPVAATSVAPASSSRAGQGPSVRRIRETLDAELLWRKPARDVSDWIEVHALATAGARACRIDPPTGDGLTSLLLPTPQAQRRALMLLSAHGIDAQASLRIRGERHKIAEHFAVFRDDERRVGRQLSSALRLVDEGTGWLERQAAPGAMARALWRGLLLSAPFVHNGDTELTLRVACPNQYRALLAAAELLRLPARRRAHRRGQSHRIAIPIEHAQTASALLTS